MDRRLSYIIIGLLCGLLVRELVVRPADSQTSSTVRAQEFLLVDGNGKVTARLYNDSFGPILRLGRAGEPYVYTSSSTYGASFLVNSSSPDEPAISMGVGGGSADLSLGSSIHLTDPHIALYSSKEDGVGMEVNGRVGEPYVLIGSSGRTAIMSVTGSSTSKTLIGANATVSRVTSNGIAVQSGLNRGHNVSLSATTQGGTVVTQRNFTTTGRLPATAGKPAAGEPATWGQIKAHESAGVEPVIESAAADDAEFERLQRELESQLHRLRDRANSHGG